MVMNDLLKPLKGKKASEVFLDYCKPLIDDLVDGNPEELKILEKSLKVPWIVWNATVLDQKNTSKIAWVGSAKIQASGVPLGDRLIEFWKSRKISEFNDYQYLMGEFKIIPKSKGDYSLKMESRYA
jgi:hypothetical protein